MDQWKHDGGTEEQLWGNSEKEMEEQWNRHGGTVNSDGGTVGQRWWNRGTVMVERWNRDG